jgi:hypothetical protein
MARKLIGTQLKLIAVPPAGGARHVTADRLRALCGLDLPGDWYTGDAGRFGEPGDCAKCYASLKAEN